MGNLFKIQKDVQSIAEVIAAALKVETEIVDDNDQVLGATGRIRSQLLTKRTDIYINRYVSEKKRPFVLQDPGSHDLCKPCAEKKECFYTGGIYYPITIKDKCHGVISLVSFNENQKNILMNNQSTFLDFIGKMADLLVVKLQETLLMDKITRSNKYLEAVINSVNQGIISCDEDGQITYFNKNAEKVMGFNKNELIGKHISHILPGSIMTKCFAEGKSIHEEKVQYTTSQGEVINLISTATLVKDGEEIVGAVESFSEEAKIYRAVYRFSNSEQNSSFKNIIGESEIMKKLKDKALLMAQSSSTILITGESGTGKELFARAIHSASTRAKEPFVPINCSAIPDSLLESELFGYEKGAFTGASNEGKPGKFELANEGTIFLDEIGDMPLHLQVKILRVLEEKSFQRVGGTKNIPVNVRIIAATHQDLKELISKKQFREDLYYRLNVIPFYLPPLRDRLEDLPVIIDYFLKKYSRLLNKEISEITADTLEALMSYKWPGNIRELQNAIEYAVNFCINSSVITKESLPEWVFNQDLSMNERSYKEKIQKTEKQILQEALQAYGASLEGKERMANKMGVSLSTLYRKLRKYNLIN